MSIWTESVERVIAAPPEKIWALVADPRRHKEISGNDTVRDAFDVPEQLKVGDTFGMNMEFGTTYTMVSTIIEYDEPRRIAWQSRPPGDLAKWRQLFGGRIWRYELEPVAGGTLVRETWDVSQEGRFGTRFLVRAYGPQTRKNMHATLKRLDELVSSA